VRPRFLRHACRPLIVALTLAATLVPQAWPASATAPNVQKLGDFGWKQVLGTSTMLHLGAEVQNNDTALDASDVSVKFNLLRSDNSLIGTESTESGVVADVLSHGGERSPVETTIPMPLGYDHYTVTTPPSAGPSATPPDHNFAVSLAPCSDLSDHWHICGTITNLNSVAVNWVRVIFTYYADSTNTSIVDGDSYDIPTDAQSSLAAGASYQFEDVRLASAPDWGGIAAFGESKTTAPEAPIAVAATAGNQQAMVSWQAPSNGGNAMTSYTVVSSPDGISLTVPSSQTSATINGLRNGVAYTFTVTATNGVGTSYPSAPSGAVVPATVPDAPSNVSAAAGNASATVTWTAPFNEGSAITSYTVTSSPAGGTATVPGSAFKAVVSGLSNGTSYTFTVSATNGVGTGPASPASNSVTPLGPPGAPTSVAAAAGNAQATVSWAAPADNGGTPITKYTVTAAPGGQTASTNDGTTLSATVTGLSNGVTYRFTVVAHNQVGDGPASSPSNAVTPSSGRPPAWQAPDNLGGGTFYTPTGVAMGSQRVDAFVVGTDRQLWHSWHDGGGWHWEPLGGLLTSSTAVISRSAGSIDVFARGGDNALWYLSYSSGRWSSWQKVGGLLASEPAAISVDGSSIDVFVQGTDNGLWQAHFSGSGWSWSGHLGVLSAAPSVASPGSGELDAFVRGSDSTLWYWTNDTSNRLANPGWYPAGGRLAAKPAALGSPGRLDVAVEGVDSSIWHWSSTSSWEPVGGLALGGVSDVSWGSPRIDLFVRGTDNGLWHAWTTGSGWQWQPLGVQLSAVPSAVSGGVNMLDVFYRQPTGSLGHIAFN
jgi:hypothetical protein